MIAPQREVGEAAESAPDDQIAGWRVAGASQVATEPGKACDAVAEGYERRVTALQQVHFRIGEHATRIGAWRHAAEHGHPEDAPAQNAEQRQQIDQAFGGAKPRFFGPASGFQDLVKRLDLPTLGVPVQLYGVRSVERILNSGRAEAKVDGWCPLREAQVRLAELSRCGGARHRGASGGVRRAA